MPVHRISKATLQEELLELERVRSERVVSLSEDGDDVIVRTESVIETRPAS